MNPYKSLNPLHFNRVTLLDNNSLLSIDFVNFLLKQVQFLTW